METDISTFSVSVPVFNILLCIQAVRLLQMDLEIRDQMSPQAGTTTNDQDMHCNTTCPNCFQMMNEIIQLRMELGRMEETNKRAKKNFTIAPTLYTFYRNGLSKRHLARSSLFCVLME